MRIRYKGGRTFYKVTFNRKSYCFTKENNRILDIKDQATINYILSMSNHYEFEVLIDEQIPVVPEVKKPVVEEKKEESKPIRKFGQK